MTSFSDLAAGTSTTGLAGRRMTRIFCGAALTAGIVLAASASMPGSSLGNRPTLGRSTNPVGLGATSAGSMAPASRSTAEFTLAGTRSSIPGVHQRSTSPSTIW